MEHTCEGCGETFGTLTSLRLHDCPAADEADEDEDEDEDEELTDAEWEAEREEYLERIAELEREEREQAQRASSTELTDALDQAASGDPDAVYQLLAYYERHLAREWEKDEDEEDCYRGFQQLYYESATTAIDDVVQAEGWPFLEELLEAYWPEVPFELQTYVQFPGFGGEDAYWEDYAHVSHVLTNVTGRYSIRTRLDDGVAAIPSRALEYLVRFHPHPGDEGAWIESMTYGWGVGHPEHGFAENIFTLLMGDYEIWVGGALEHAIHADQQAATDLIERAFQNDIVDDPGMLFSSLSHIDRDEYPYEPQYWDWEMVYPDLAANGFEWDTGVEARLRGVVEETGWDEGLPAEWTFADIEL